MSHINADNPTFTGTCTRSPGGQFGPGNPGGPGNPYARKVAFLRNSLNECISASQVKQVVGAMFQLALAGNVAAARLFLQYAVGKPQEACNPDRIEIDEFQLRQDSIVQGKDITAQAGRMPLAATNTLISASEYKMMEGLIKDLETPLPTAPVATAEPPRHQTVETANPPRHQTVETANPPRYQTVETANPPVGQVADLPKAPENMVPRTPDRHQTVVTAETHRHQTVESARETLASPRTAVGG